MEGLGVAVGRLSDEGNSTECDSLYSALGRRQHLVRHVSLPGDEQGDEKFNGRDRQEGRTW